MPDQKNQGFQQPKGGKNSQTENSKQGSTSSSDMNKKKDEENRTGLGKENTQRSGSTPSNKDQSLNPQGRTSTSSIEEEEEDNEQEEPRTGSSQRSQDAPRKPESRR